jgi:hypothetical protein
MVAIAPPPPGRPPDPLFHTLQTGHHVIRIFDPTRHNTTATLFRYFGPLLRFDHQRADPQGRPTVDPDRGIYYAALTLSGCLVEIFGDTGIIVCGERHVARVRLTRDLQLLDLRQTGAMRAGCVAAISKTADHRQSQEWSRYFYEHPALYATVDGIFFFNAHNDEDAIALYERAGDALDCPPQQTIRLDDRAIRPAVLTAARDNNLLFSPP